MQYALLIYSPFDVPEEARREIDAGVAAVLARPDVTGWVRLHAAESATMVRHQDGTTLLTDGPFVDSKEFLAGVILVEAANLDEALAAAGAAGVRCDRGAADPRRAIQWRLTLYSATSGDGCWRRWSGSSATSSWPRTPRRRRSRSPRNAGPEMARWPTRPAG